MKSPLARATVAAAALALGAVLAVPAPSAAAPANNAARAAATYQALQKYLAVPDGSYLYHERYPVQSGDNAYSYEWPFSQVHMAALDLTGLPGAAGRSYQDELATAAKGQERYWKADGGTTGVAGYASYAIAPYGGGGDFFYDDNEWVGLEKVQRYLMTGDRAALSRAEDVFALVKSGWDTDATHAAPGGVFWTQATWSTDRNTVSNMPAAELGLRLYQITHQKSYLDWSLRMYDWTNTYLLSPQNLYWDHLDLAGNVEKTFWSYNQGVPVGVGVLLYQVTHDRKYLAQAKATARAAYDYYVTGGRLAGQPPFFNSIFFANLLLLESVTGGHTYRDAMAAYADQVWTTRRDAATGLFHFDSDGTTEAIQQAAMAQIYALLAWPRGKTAVVY
jgi:hypothetical protein